MGSFVTVDINSLTNSLGGHFAPDKTESQLISMLSRYVTL